LKLTHTHAQTHTRTHTHTLGHGVHCRFHDIARSTRARLTCSPVILLVCLPHRQTSLTGTQGIQKSGKSLANLVRKVFRPRCSFVIRVAGVWPISYEDGFPTLSLADLVFRPYYSFPTTSRGFEVVIIVALGHAAPSSAS
jgi:hypothetical protein